MRVFTWTLILAFSAGLLAGCSSSSSPSQPPAKQLTPAEQKAKAKSHTGTITD